MTEFRDSKEAEFRRSIRASIRSGPFTKGQRDVTLAFFNHWLHHRKSRAGVVFPGRKRLARKAGVTIKTVSRTLDVLREHGVINAEAHLEGLHGMATEYTVSVVRLYEFCAKKRTETRKYGGTNVPTLGRDKMSRRISNVLMFPDQGAKASEGGA